MRKSTTWIAGILAMALIITAIAGFAAPAKADTAAAEAMFKAKCAACHGADGKGKEVMKTRDLGSADVQKQSDADLSGIISKGKGKMPAYGSLTADQLKDMVAFIRSFKK
ncbi:MAG TPA: cytochrome c [Terriglobales bacterium]|nr:cytochrome c [Terriglobales bacterium]